ncbi:MAG: FkbM family methyltransferase [Caldilineaceae bacterium]|nr:FkbM family methyltransferase [Caldilineaceae bacterium]
MKSLIKKFYYSYVRADYPLLPLTKHLRRPLRWYYHLSPVLQHDTQFHWKPFLLKTIHKTFIQNIPQDFTIFHDQIRFRSYGTDMALHGYYVGEIEYHLIQFLANCIEPDFVMFDVGAHHGLFTTITAYILKQNGWSGVIHSFEPFTDNFSLLQHNVSQNNAESFVELYPYAVANQVGEQNFIINQDENSDNALQSEIELDRAQRNTISHKVEVTTLDSFMPQVDHVNLIKIDVQGGEPFVLQGAQNLIAKYQPIIIVEAVQDLPSTKETQKFLLENNYDIFGVTQDGKLCEPNSQAVFISWDWVGIPRSRHFNFVP